MRRLIRPCLFGVTRLALCISLLAWIGAYVQQAGPYGQIESPMGSLLAGLTSRGWLFVYAKSQSAFSMDIVYAGDEGFERWFTDMPLVYLVRSPRIFVAVRHWLVVLVLSLIYGLLKLVYRQRSEPITDAPDATA